MLQYLFSEIIAKVSEAAVQSDASGVSFCRTSLSNWLIMLFSLRWKFSFGAAEVSMLSDIAIAVAHTSGRFVAMLDWKKE